MTKEAEGVVSVVVVTRNEARDIVRCLASIRAQSVSEIEIVVVDNASTDDTPALAASLADVVLDAGPERSAQRNAGARAATGSYLLFVDADMQLTERVVAECLGAVERGATAVVIPEMSVGRRPLDRGEGSRALLLSRRRHCGGPAILSSRDLHPPRRLRRGSYRSRGLGFTRQDAVYGDVWSDNRAHRPPRGPSHVAGLDAEEVRLRQELRRVRATAPDLARAQVLRPAFVREWRRLAATPGVALLMIVMKLLEYLSGRRDSR